MRRVEFRLPDLGEGIAEAEVVRWRVRVGERVQRDQPLVEVQTDKAVMVLPSPACGRVAELGAGEGETVRVGQVLVAIEAEEAEGTGPAPFDGEAVPGVEEPAGIVGETPTPVQAPVRVLAAPAVRRLARELGVDLERVAGTGPDGRITEQDVRREASRLGRPQAADGPGRAADVRVALGPTRRAIARHLSEAVARVPHVTVMDEADVTDLVRLRARLKTAAEQAGLHLTYLPFVVKAVTLALKAVPVFNATVDEAAGELVLHASCHIGVATATPRGLVVPVVRDAHRKSVAQLARDIEELAEAARAGRLTPGQLRGSTFTVTSLGASGGLFATPIINHPEVAILGVHRIQERPVVREGQIVVRSMMNLTLTFDHRVADGEDAARLLAAVIGHLEQPEALLLQVQPSASGAGPEEERAS